MLTVDVMAANPWPLEDQSAVDGYAVRHSDVCSAGVRLPVDAVIPAGALVERPVLRSRTATRVLTGGLLPVGADTVVRQELTVATEPDVEVMKCVDLGADVRRRGEEFIEGALLANAGAAVTPGLIGALALAGVDAIDVSRPPAVRVVVTGDEVVHAGVPLALGEIPDANGPMIVATLRAWGIEDVSVVHVRDRFDEIATTLAEGLDCADVVITTGGVSVGDFDVVPDAAESVGVVRVLWKVAQRPGGPIYVGRRGDSMLLGLPGNPAAVFLALHVYVRFALDVLQGRDPDARWQLGWCDSAPHEVEGKTNWLRCRAEVDADGRVRLQPLGHQHSHMLSNLADANAIARIAPRGEATAPPVPWISLGGGEPPFH